MNSISPHWIWAGVVVFIVFMLAAVAEILIDKGCV